MQSKTTLSSIFLCQYSAFTGRFFGTILQLENSMLGWQKSMAVKAGFGPLRFQIQIFLFMKAILRSTIKQQISFVLEKKAIEYGSFSSLSLTDIVSEILIL